MKRFLLFAWPDGKIWDASTFAGWNCFRGSYDNLDDSMFYFYRDFDMFEFGQAVDTKTGEVWHLNQLKS